MGSYPTVTPYLVVPDADKELEFLQTAFGGTIRECHRNGSQVVHAEVSIGDSLVMLGQAGDQWKPMQAGVFLWVDDVDATYEKALAAGATSQRAPADMPYGQRAAGVTDGCAITWWLGSPLKGA